MFFNSFVFIFYFAAVVLVHRILPRRYRNLFLIVASYTFYGYWDWRFLFLILASTILDFFVGRAIPNQENLRWKKLLLTLSVAGNLSILGVFKYFNFFSESFVALVSVFGIELDYTHLNIILPVGISFYTFQTMSYTIDIYRGKLSPTNSFANFALFVAFFPQLVAGPIERAVHLLPQIERRPQATRQDFREGFTLLATGYFKKVMIGDTCGRIVDHIFADPALFSSPELLMAVMLFAIQVYADFSGYSNIARGTARFLGIHIVVNFNQPYLSANITQVWRRWHMSLSLWVRDYLYIPLGGNRKGLARTYLNLMVALSLIGLWHGAMWTFVAFGALHGFYLCVHKFLLRGKKAATEFHYTTAWAAVTYVFKVIGTHGIWLFGLLIFRSKSFGDAWFILKKLMFWEPCQYTPMVLRIIVTYYVTTIVLDLIEYWTNDHTFMLRVSPAYRLGIYVAVLGITLVYMFQAPVLPFVYFQF